MTVWVDLFKSENHAAAVKVTGPRLPGPRLVSRIHCVPPSLPPSSRPPAGFRTEWRREKSLPPVGTATTAVSIVTGEANTPTHGRLLDISLCPHPTLLYRLLFSCWIRRVPTNLHRWVFPLPTNTCHVTGKNKEQELVGQEYTGEHRYTGEITTWSQSYRNYESREAN